MTGSSAHGPDRSTGRSTGLRRRHAVGRLLAALLLAGLVVGVCATAGSAHAQLIGTSPGDGARLGAVPDVVRLTFSDPLDPRFVRVRVTGPGGVAVAVDPAVAGPVVAVTPPDRGPGRYVVAYRVVSRDGHPVSGTTTFRVTAPGSPSSTAPSRSATPSTAALPATEPTSGSGGDPLAPVLAALLVVVTALGAAAWFAARRGSR